MFTTGRVCLKKAGRDSGRYCVVVEESEKGYVIIDGQTRRKRCNIQHLEPTKKTIKISEKADTKSVKEALEKEGILVKEKKQSKSPQERPKRQKVQREKKQETQKSEAKKTKEKSEEK